MTDLDAHVTARMLEAAVERTERTLERPILRVGAEGRWFRLGSSTRVDLL